MFAGISPTSLFVGDTGPFQQVVGLLHLRLSLGDKVLSEYKPLEAFRRKRSRGGPYWLVVGASSKSPDCESAWSIDPVNGVIGVQN